MATSTTISGLTALGAAPATTDLFVAVDVSDPSQAPSGTTKKLTVTNLFTTPTMTAPVITGGLTVSAGGAAITGTVTITGAATVSAGLTVSSGGVTITAGGLTVSAGTTAVQALTATTTVIGTDPGGSEILRVGGSIRASGMVTSTVASGVFLNAASATTGSIYSEITSTGGSLRYGLASSAGGVFGGISAYAAVFGTTNATSVQIATNNSVRLSIDSAGVVTLVGYGGGTGVVSVGAADSGGAGFKLLRVPN